MVAQPHISLTELAPFDKDSSPRSLQVLSTINRDLLLAAFAEEDGSAPKGSAAHKILESLLTRHLWLGCSCKNGSLASAPVLYVQSRRSSIRPLTLVRNHSRGLHDTGCPFSRPAKPKGHSLAIRTKSRALGVLKRAQVASTKGTKATVAASTSKSERTPSIANVLFTVLEQAGCNRFLGQPRSLTNDAKRVQDALLAFHMDTRNKIPANEYFGTNLHRFSAISRRVELAAQQKTWPSNLPPHGFVIGLCEVQRDSQKRLWLVEPKRSSSAPNRWQVTGRVRLPGPGTPGPSLAIGLIAIPSGNQKAEMVQAYVHPANSFDDLTLVDSDLERQTLAILTEHLAEMRQRGQAYSVIKPYLDITGAKSRARYRPDFILMKNGRTRYIETMGYADTEYLLRKARVHQAMSGEQPVLQHHPGKNDAQFRTQIETFIGY